MTRPAVSATRRIHALLASLLLISLSFAVAQEETVVDVAASTPDFSTLLNALDAAGLTETLQGTGPYTVFAPTNDAFAKLSDAELSALLADREALSRVLSYHVVPGSFTTADITEDMTGFTTLAGSDLPITSAGVGDAAVTAIDLLASNGVVFAIDTVLTPPDEAAAEDELAPENTLYAGSARASERFELAEVGGSGVAGSVLVAEYEGERAVVTVSLSGTPAGGEHPAALYAGSCEMLLGDAFSGDPVAELEAVSGDLGFSTTVTDPTFEAIVSGDHALAVGLSADDPTVVACGEVGQ